MLSAIGAAAVSNPILARSDRSSAAGSCGKGSPVGSSSAVWTDMLSLSEPESLPASDGFYQRTSLTVRAHSQTMVSNDGQVRAILNAKLRFSYDFEAADGTKIRVRAKVNLNYSQSSGGDDGTQSTRLQVQARVSVLQEAVSTGIAPLLETPDTSDEAKSVISQAVDLFQQVTSAAASLFLDSDPLDGDSLIGRLVDAFNQFSGSLNSQSLPSPQVPVAVTSGDVGEVLGQAPADPLDVAAAGAAPIESVPPVVVESEPVSGPAQQNTGELSGPENVPIQNVGQKEASAIENTVAPEDDASENPGAGHDVEAAASQPSQPSVGSVMLTLRLRVIQSLRSLVEAFDSDSRSLLVSQSTLSMSAQLAARYSSSGPRCKAPASHDRQIDAYAGP
jgi:hypothetical protein